MHVPEGELTNYLRVMIEIRLNLQKQIQTCQHICGCKI